ncbi:hypothetical protein JTB14_002954 [Gonioctena quinquepunctata]|nr:hypothetical protein JTB14_002954 [Gonioctena quinquepunctata]
MEIDEMLNNITHFQTWQDIKSWTTSKVSGMRSDERATGGGPPIEDISKSDENIINIVKVVFIEGHNETTESAVDFDFDALEQTNGKMVVEEELTTAEGNEMLQTPSTSSQTLKPVTKKKKSTTLRHTVDAVNEYKKGMEGKNGMKKNIEETFKLLVRIAGAKERKANAAERKAENCFSQ